MIQSPQCQLSLLCSSRSLTLLLAKECSSPTPTLLSISHFFATSSQYPTLLSMECRKRGHLATVQVLPVDSQPSPWCLSWAASICLMPKAWRNEGFSHFLHPTPSFLLLLIVSHLSLPICWIFQIWLLQNWINRAGKCFSPTVPFTPDQSWNIGIRYELKWELLSVACN